MGKKISAEEEDRSVIIDLGAFKNFWIQ